MKASPLGTPAVRGLRKTTPAVAALMRGRHARAAAVCAPCGGSRHDQGAAWFALIHGAVLALAAAGAERDAADRSGAMSAAAHDTLLVRVGTLRADVRRAAAQANPALAVGRSQLRCVCAIPQPGAAS